VATSGTTTTRTRTRAAGNADFRFFGGKGGVGKTTCAAAAALAAARARHRVLLVSTDPAHSLGDALTLSLGARPRPVGGAPGLDAAEMDADRALERWMGARRRPLRTIAERGTYLDEEDVDRFLRLSLPGVDELIGLVELARLSRSAPYREVVVDTAPTGHTLRLLAMPQMLRRLSSVLDDMHAKHRFLAHSLGADYRPDAADALIDELEREGRTLAELLRDPARCTFSWIVLPEMLAVEEARDGVRALETAGIRVTEIIVNSVYQPPARSCPHATARARAEQDAIAAIRVAFPRYPIRLVAAQPREPRGISALRSVARALRARGGLLPPGRSLARRRPARAVPARSAARPHAGAASPVLDIIAPAGIRLLAFAGKGGVGKTTCATAAAIALAERPSAPRVLLLSTDPAHSIADVLGTPLDDEERPVPGAAPGLRARELDAERAFQQRRERYRIAVDDLFAAVMGGSRLEVAFDREVVQQLIDLAPPGLDELFAILTVIEALFHRKPAPYDVIVLDTAPTGHALRLLQMPAAALEWVHALIAILLKYRAVVGLGDLATDLVEIAHDLRGLQDLLRDGARARVVAVTRAADLPRLETDRLLARLRTLGIAVSAILVNAVPPDDCVRCRAAGRASASRKRYAMISAPAVFPPPHGVDELRQWARRWE
jgi:arsenite-transporting ATPase